MGDYTRGWFNGLLQTRS